MYLKSVRKRTVSGQLVSVRRSASGHLYADKVEDRNRNHNFNHKDNHNYNYKDNLNWWMIKIIKMPIEDKISTYLYLSEQSGRDKQMWHGCDQRRCSPGKRYQRRNMKQWKNQGGCPASGANKSWGRSAGERVIIDFGAGMFRREYYDWSQKQQSVSEVR